MIPTEDQKNEAEGVFLVFLVWTIFMRVVVVSSVSVAGRRGTTYTASYSTPTHSATTLYPLFMASAHWILSEIDLKTLQHL